MNLQEQGFRYVERRGVFFWVDPCFMLPGDVDCTDMTDEAFEAHVHSVTHQEVPA